MAATWEAVADAGLDVAGGVADAGEDAGWSAASGVDPDRVGVVIKAAVAGFDTIERATRQVAGLDQGRLDSHFVSSSLANMPACEVTIDLGIRGPVTAATTNAIGFGGQNCVVVLASPSD